jgi:hypothetical protein
MDADDTIEAQVFPRYMNKPKGKGNKIIGNINRRKAAVMSTAGGR